MAETSGFFNSHVVDGNYDRVYLAEQFAKYFASFIGNGVFGGKLSELMVTQHSAGGMKVSVLPGMAWINGFWYENSTDLTLDVSVSDGVVNRIDNIVVRWGKVERKVWIDIVRGTPSTNAIAPAIVRNSDYYDLKIAEIHVKAGLTSVTQTDIVDTRLNNEVCGLVTGLVDQIDTAEYVGMLNSFVLGYMTEFKAYLKSLETNGIEELDRVLSRLEGLIDDENAFASLVLDVDSIASNLAIANQTLGYVKKNLIPYPYTDKSKLSNGVNWVDNGDGTITANGTTTGTSYFNIFRGNNLRPGKYYLTSGANTSASYYVYFTRLDKTNNAYVGKIYRDHNNDIIELTQSDIDNYNFLISVYVDTGISLSNVIFKPMLRRIEIIDDTWEPFRLSVAEMIQEDEQDKGCFYRINRLNGKKEWINPACAPGWEYPLVERWNNQPVYQMTLYAASLPNNSAMVLKTNAEWDRLISASGYAIDKDDLTLYPFPVILHSQVMPIAVISRIESDGSLIITTNSDASYLEAYVTIKYTKSY